MVSGNLQIKNDRYYMVLDLYENGKRKQKWISTGLITKGNKKRAEAMLLEKRSEYEKLQEKPKENDLLFSDFLTT